jgi:inhibitor of KinA sporulation pathway (predicted exonuclease)
MKELLRCWTATAQPLIVMDLELTAWEGSLAADWTRPGEYKEIVQIGAVRLAPDLSEVGAFSQYVRPAINPILSCYFTNLTGITQQTVEAEGVDFPSAMRDFADFAKGAAAIASNGPDGEVMIENCRLSGIDCPINGASFRNIRKDLGRALALGDQGTDSFALCTLIGRQTVGRAHDGLSDARSIAAALRFIAGMP